MASVNALRRSQRHGSEVRCAGSPPSSASRSAASSRSTSPARSTGWSRRSSAERITGMILGAVQSWGLGANGPSARQWIIATGAGLDRRARRRRRRGGLRHRAWATSSSRARSAVLRSEPRKQQFCVLGSARLAFAWVPALERAVGTRLGHHHRERRSTSKASTRFWFQWCVGRHGRHRGPARIPRNPHHAERIVNRHVVFGTGQVGRHVVARPPLWCHH